MLRHRNERFRGREDQWSGLKRSGRTGKWLGFVIGKRLNKGGGLTRSFIPFGHRTLITSHTFYPKGTTSLMAHFQSAAANSCWPTCNQSFGNNSPSKNFSREQDCLFWLVWVTLSAWNMGKACCSRASASLAVLRVFCCWVVLLQSKPHSGQTEKLMSNTDQWHRQLFPAYKISLNDNQQEQALYNQASNKVKLLLSFIWSVWIWVLAGPVPSGRCPAAYAKAGFIDTQLSGKAPRAMCAHIQMWGWAGGRGGKAWDELRNTWGNPWEQEGAAGGGAACQHGKHLSF